MMHISRPVESNILTTASHMISLCLNISDVIAQIGLTMNCLLGVLGKIFKYSFAASCCKHLHHQIIEITFYSKCITSTYSDADRQGTHP